MPEILAPAGSREALTAAVRCGANAVYFGGKAFNARRNASNFTDEEIAEAVDYCHKHNVKVYITLNTLAGDNELKDAVREIVAMCRAGVDGFIIQDVGLASVVKQVCPSVPIHASTQMSVQSVDGIEVLKELGFCRAVIPRELSQKEIRYISQHTDMELEYFVHGALCMCVSGQCLMSSVLGGRSGNRGLCAQPCRLPFGVNGKGGNNLSLKDLSLIDRIDELTDAGVYSLKIEGRMKRPEYVAAAVTACRNSVNNTPDNKISDSLNAVFSRSGFTSGYFDGRLGKEMFGTRTKEDVENASSAVLSSLSHLYDNENPLIPVDMFFTMTADSLPALKVTSGNYFAECSADVMPCKALNKPVTSEEASARLSKCGGTQFYVNSIDCNVEDGLNIPASALNALRRNALSLLETEISARPEPEIFTPDLSTTKHISSGRKIHLRFFDESQISADLKADRVIVPLETSEETVKKLINNNIEVAAEIPVNVFSNSEEYLEKLLALKAFGVKLAWVCNLDGVNIAKRAGLPFATGFGMNVFNTESIKAFEKMGATDILLSCEMSLRQIENAGQPFPRGVMVYGRIPLMVTRNCPVKNKLTCAQCGGKSELCDRMNVRFPVRCKNGACFILNSRPLCVYDRKAEFKNVDFDLLYFTTESADECSRIITDYKNDKAPDYEYTRGLYYKTVL